MSQDVKREVATEDLGEEGEERNRFPLRNHNQATQNDSTNSMSRATTPSIGRKILRTEPF